MLLTSTVMCLGIFDYVLFILYGVCWASWIWKSTFFNIWENVVYYFFKYFFSALFIVSFSPRTPIICIFDLALFSHQILMLIHFFKKFCFSDRTGFITPEWLTFWARSLSVACGKGSLCIVGHLAASLTTTTRCQWHSLPFVTTKNISTHF